MKAAKLPKMRSISGETEVGNMKARRLSLAEVKALFILLLFSIGFSALGQDLIYKKDGTTLKAKVYEVSNDKVRYKMFENLGGPFYYTYKGDIDHIEYENGFVESYASIPQRKPRKLGLGANIGGPSIFYSVELDYRISHNFDLEAGFGRTGAWAGVNYMFKDLRYESISPYIGFIANVWFINGFQYQGFYAPLGVSVMNQKLGIGISGEVAWMNRFTEVKTVWAGLKLSAHF